jgi:predicted O-methyltransferase YrrM
MTPQILKLIDELDAQGKIREDAWQISREEGELLHQIALSTNARVVVEIGTSYGFSALFWGAALLQTGGLLHTIDINPAKAESAKKTFVDAGLDKIIINHVGAAVDILAELKGPIDLAFIDADKPSTKTYFDLIWPKLRHGGSILIDNATTHKEQLADVITYIRSLPDSLSQEVAVGNGLEWTIKIEKKKE